MIKKISVLFDNSFRKGVSDDATIAHSPGFGLAMQYVMKMQSVAFFGGLPPHDIDHKVFIMLTRAFRITFRLYLERDLIKICMCTYSQPSKDPSFIGYRAFRVSDGKEVACF